MKRVFLSLVVALFVLGGAATLPRPSSAQMDWPPLLNCADVTGSGAVALPDVLAVISAFGSLYPNDDYLLLYDLNGGGSVALPDILVAVTQFGDLCPTVETQVARATLATLKYRDPAVAIADGYVQTTQYVPQMGIHMYNLGFQAAHPRFDSSVCDPAVGLAPACQLEFPAGLVYTATPSGAPDKLVGLWYVVPNQEVCDYFGVDPDGDTVPGPCDNTEPEGFDGPEDNTDLHPQQRGWHTHTGLCGGGWSTSSAWVVETGSASSEQDCLNGTWGPCPCAWFANYGWMMHLYTMIPNPDGRFMMWNANAP